MAKWDSTYCQGFLAGALLKSSKDVTFLTGERRTLSQLVAIQGQQA